MTRLVSLVLASGAAIAGCARPAPPAPRPAPSSPHSQSPDVYTTANDWATLPTEPYRGKRDDVFFVDGRTGWYGTGAGDLFHTRDGGESWTKIASKPGTFIRAVGFVNASNGFIGNLGTDYYPGVTDTTPLYRTRDGGATWEPVDTGARTIKGVCAIDIVRAKRIYQGKLVDTVVIHAAGRVGGPAEILRSVDGGETWTAIDLGDRAGMILDIKFVDENVGLVFASSSRDPETTQALILRTEDGGASWSEAYRGSRPAELIWKASLPTREIGYATVQSYATGHSRQLIVKTSDGGASWTELPLVDNAEAREFGIGFVDSTHGWVGTAVGGFYTADGGASFAPVAIAPLANKIRVVSTPGGSVVFAIGSAVQRLTPSVRPEGP